MRKKILPAFKKKLCSRKYDFLQSLYIKRIVSTQNASPSTVGCDVPVLPLPMWVVNIELTAEGLLYPVAATFAGVRKVIQKAPVCLLCSGRGRHLLLSEELSSAQGWRYLMLPSWVEKGNLRSCRQYYGGAGILAVGQSKL